MHVPKKNIKNFRIFGLTFIEITCKNSVRTDRITQPTRIWWIKLLMLFRAIHALITQSVLQQIHTLFQSGLSRHLNIWRPLSYPNLFFLNNNLFIYCNWVVTRWQRLFYYLTSYSSYLRLLPCLLATSTSSLTQGTSYSRRD